MSGNLGQFQTEVNEWIIGVLGLTVDVIREATVELCMLIIDDTPVQYPPRDGTVARGDWVSDLGTMPADVSRNDNTGDAALAQVRSVVAHWNPVSGEPFIFANYKDYIERIEYLGWNGHAPYGMVGKHVIEWNDIVEEAVGSARR